MATLCAMADEQGIKLEVGAGVVREIIAFLERKDEARLAIAEEAVAKIGDALPLIAGFLSKKLGLGGGDGIDGDFKVLLHSLSYEQIMKLLKSGIMSPTQLVMLADLLNKYEVPTGEGAEGEGDEADEVEGETADADGQVRT